MPKEVLVSISLPFTYFCFSLYTLNKDDESGQTHPSLYFTMVNTGPELLWAVTFSLSTWAGSCPSLNADTYLRVLSFLSQFSF